MSPAPAPRVFIIDDSALVRQVLAQVLAGQGINVIGSAADPLFAQSRLEKDWPDVIVLDMEMPRMDGLTFLRKLMRERPTPVVVCSTLTDKGAALTVEALSAGAVSVFAKAATGVRDGLTELGRDLARAIREAAQARPAQPAAAPVRPVAPLPANRAVSYRTTNQVIAIGTSTGGTQALEKVLTALMPGCPGLVIVQHMPEKFTAAFATRLNGLCRIDVAEACEGDWVRPGLALVAPGGRHMQLYRSGAQYRVHLLDGPPVNRHRPSVDVLLRSVAQVAGANAIGVVMTGMGNDGARGLLAMREAGAHTLAQDEASCVVFGMPREAIALGAAAATLPLADIPAALLRC